MLNFFAWRYASGKSFPASLQLFLLTPGSRYGGKLLSTREYDVVQFFVIYIAIVLVRSNHIRVYSGHSNVNLQGGQASGHFGSLTPSKLPSGKSICYKAKPDTSQTWPKLPWQPAE